MNPDPVLQTVLKEIQHLRAGIGASRKALLTVDEAASFLGVSPRTIRNGLGPKAVKPFPVMPVRVCGRVLFKRNDLERFVDGL